MRVTHPARIVARGRFSAGRFHLPATPRGELESRSPYDPDDLIGVFPYGEEDLPEALAAARKAARLWGTTALELRLAALRRFRDLLNTRLPELSVRLKRETGRPPWECRREAAGLVGRLDQLLAHTPGDLQGRDLGPVGGRVASYPLGVVAVVGPASLPVAQSHAHLSAALAAGNVVIWKPSQLCPASAQLYLEAVAAAGFPDGVFGAIYGGDDVGEALCAQPGLDAIVFTGSAEHGQELRRRLLDHHDCKLILHLGAKNAALVLDDADLELAVHEVVQSSFLTAGQRCTAVSRLLCDARRLEELLSLLLPMVEGLRVGPPGPNVFFGPMLSQARMERFQDQLDGAAEQGADVLLRGERLDRPGWFVGPSVHRVHHRQADAPYQRDELFGPDLAVYAVDGPDDAFDLCNQSPYGLCAALFCQQAQRWARFQERVRAGVLLWNKGTYAISGALPFGGVKLSGHGGVGGADAILALRREVALQHGTPETVVLFPGTRDDVTGTGSDELTGIEDEDAKAEDIDADPTDDTNHRTAGGGSSDRAGGLADQQAGGPGSRASDRQRGPGRD